MTSGSPEWDAAGAVRRKVRESVAAQMEAEAEEERRRVAGIQQFLGQVQEHSDFLARMGEGMLSRPAVEPERPKPRVPRKRWRSRNFFFVHRLLCGTVGGVIPLIFASPYIIANSDADPFGVLRVAAILYACGFGYFFIRPD